MERIKCEGNRLLRLISSSLNFREIITELDDCSKKYLLLIRMVTARSFRVNTGIAT